MRDRYRLLMYALILMLLTAVEAQGAWVLQGSASPPDANGMIAITPAANNQVAAAWLDTPIDFADNFDISLVVNLGDRDADGADGLAIVFQNDIRGTGALGDLNDGGRWIGMHGIYPALAVEIDTWYNAENGNEFNDLPADHAGINLLYDAASLLNHSAAGPVQALSGGNPNIEDGGDHLVRLVWNSVSGLLTVFVDNAQRLTYSNSNIASLFGGSSSVWFGVTGSTGGAFNRQQFKAELAGSEITIDKSVMPAAVDPAGLVTYTITVRNDSLITAFINQVEDELPAGFTYQPGSVSGLANIDPLASGQTLTWYGNWPLDPGASAVLTFQAQSSAIPGLYYNNATVRGSNFATMATDDTAMVTVGSDSLPAAGSKPLYLYNNNGNVLNLSRVPLAATQPYVAVNQNRTAAWTLAPPPVADLIVTAGDIPVAFWVWGANSPLFFVDLYTSSLGVIATGGPYHPSSGGWYRFADTVRLPSDTTIPAGDTIELRIRNRHSGTFYLYPYYQNSNCSLTLDAQTVINVDLVAFYDAPYPGGSLVTAGSASGSVYIRAVVSDPFGSFDISGATLILEGPTGVRVVDGAAMTELAAESGGAHKTFEYAFPDPPAVWPATDLYGTWTARVTAEEGTEGLVRHTNVGTLHVLSPPDIVLMKSVQTTADPVNGAANPKAIPGASVTYTISAGNHGDSGTDPDSVVIIDQIPTNTVYYAGNLGQPWGPVAFIDNPPLSGLTFNPATDLAFSIDGGSTFTLSAADLVADADGCDGRVTHIRVNPKGVFNGVSSGVVPEFVLQFRVRVQ